MFFEDLPLFEKPVLKNDYRIFLNGEDSVVTFDSRRTRREPTRGVIVGETGTGKTYCLAVVLNQYSGDVLFFEPSGQIIELFTEIGVEDDWNYYSICSGDGLLPDKIYKRLQLNASELQPSIADVIYKEKNERKPRETLRNILSDEDLTYESLRQGLIEKKLDDFWREVKIILSPTDEGITLKELWAGKNILDISNLGNQNRVLAVIINSIFTKRSRNKSYSNTSLLMCIDEMQDSANKETEVAAAFSIVNTQGRKFGIDSVLTGVSLRKVYPGLRGQLNTFFIFRISGEDMKKIKGQFEIALYPEDFSQFTMDEKGHCYYWSKMTPEDAPREFFISPDWKYAKELKIDDEVFDFAKEVLY